MTLYLDSSALAKLYVEEVGSELVEELVRSGERSVTARHTYVEVRRVLARRTRGPAKAQAAREFARDWDALEVIELDEAVCGLAADAAESLGVTTVDALHLGAAQRAGGTALSFVTFDTVQAEGARRLGFTVVGAEEGRQASQPTPSPSRSKPCGSEPSTRKRW